MGNRAPGVAARAPGRGALASLEWLAASMCKCPDNTPPRPGRAAQRCASDHTWANTVANVPRRFQLRNASCSARRAGRKVGGRLSQAAEGACGVTAQEAGLRAPGQGRGTGDVCSRRKDGSGKAGWATASQLGWFVSKAARRAVWPPKRLLAPAAPPQSDCTKRATTYCRGARPLLLRPWPRCRCRLEARPSGAASSTEFAPPRSGPQRREG